MLTLMNREDWVPFRCEVEPERGRVRVAPHGELDMVTSPKVELKLRELVDAGFDHVVLDLRGVVFMDSTGLRMVMGQEAAARADGRTFALIPGPPGVQRIFEVAQMLHRLPFLPA